MQEFTISFRFGSRQNRDEVLRSIEKVAERFGFKVVAKHSEHTRLFTRAALESARRFLASSLPPEARRSLSQTSKELAHRITRHVNITVIEMARKSRKIPVETFTIRYCLRNWYPAVGIELWERCRADLPAGMITVKLESIVVSKQVRKALLDIGHNR